jgi:hypothetical protein
MTTPETATPATPTAAIPSAMPDVDPAVAAKAPVGKENVLPKDKPVNKPVAAVTPGEAEPASGDTKVIRVAKAPLRNKIIFSLSIIGVGAALIAAYIFGMERKAQPPVFKPVSSPFDNAIYANGIIESDQPSGANINIYPEVSGPITQVLVREGQQVSAGTPLFTIDDSVQSANTEQLRLQFEASLALLEELKAQPRKETLAIAKAQVGLAESNLKVTQDQYDKRRASYDSIRNPSARTCWMRRQMPSIRRLPPWTSPARNMISLKPVHGVTTSATRRSSATR